MLDFFEIREKSVVRSSRNRESGTVEIYPDFKVSPLVKDLMVRGKSFYAIWDEERGLWSTNEYDVQRLVDQALMEYKNKKDDGDSDFFVRTMGSNGTGSWKEYKFYLSRLPTSSEQLDNKLIFSNTPVKKSDYASKKLPYPLAKGSTAAFDEIIETLYDPEEQAKIEWAIGSVVSGDSKDIQKFFVLFGKPGEGKSTIMNIIEKLFVGYCTIFEADALTSSTNAFATEAFSENPLVAIQHDSDLSKISDNTKLNSIISHEGIRINEKYKVSYIAKANCLLFIGTNKPVKITDAMSGIKRRLIDVRTSGRLIPVDKYFTLVSQIDFELGAIAYKCWQRYLSMGRHYYSNYVPLDMMLRTDIFFNFVEENFQLFKEQDGVSLLQAYTMFKEYCLESGLDSTKTPKYRFRDELRNYFEYFHDYKRIGDKQHRNYYEGFIISKFTSGTPVVKEEHPSWLCLDQTVSLFDDIAKDYPAQYASDKGTPSKKWKDVTTKLSDLDTQALHYVLLPLNHIIIDFDLKDENGQKSVVKNMEAASKWPATYGEYSKSKAGIHLHYIYEGDVDKLANLYQEGIEIIIPRVGPVGQSSLRRKLSKCNNIPIASINSGLPQKEEKVITADSVKSERGLRDLILRNLKKEFHPGTKPSVDFIHKILEDAYNQGLKYDVTDMRPKVMAFAANSSNHSEECLKLVAKMKFKSEEATPNIEKYKNDQLVFFDLEVFPNLLAISWKVAGPEHECVRMINPEPQDIEGLLNMKLVGFNNRKYDNHILYARWIGYSIYEIYTLSTRIINESKNSMFSDAYNISYTDIYDFASAGNKKSLKKFEIELGIHHMELGLPWDQPVPEEKWPQVMEYCDNDVIATEAVFNHLSGDWVARQIIAELSGLSVNDTTNQHSTRIIFGNNKNPQSQFVYTDLSTIFPGYTFENGKSSYRGEDPGEGGEVYSEPGYYEDVEVDDVVSMHPSSIENLNAFGPYTKIYSDIKKARVAIKHGDIESLKSLMDGKFIPFVKRSEAGEFKLKDLSTALKTVLNSVYGLTSAHFDNPFKDPRNKDNIVAKRGALFMIDLRHAVQEQGFTVAHIKTDSIKIPNATPEIVNFVMEFGKKYGYEFEREVVYDRFCLVNDAVYIARIKNGPNAGKWTATGAQFAEPYVFKTLFSKEPITFEDLCVTKAVTTSLYLDFNEIPFGPEHDYHFVGKVGLFVPIKPNCGGGLLLREKDGKFYSATGAKGYRWLEAEVVKLAGKEDDIDLRYFDELAQDAIDTISEFVDFNKFVS